MNLKVNIFLDENRLFGIVWLLTQSLDVIGVCHCAQFKAFQIGLL